MASRQFDKVSGGGRRTHPSLSRVVRAVTAVLVTSGSAGAQSPDPRLVAAKGTVNPAHSVWETTLAAGPNMVMSVYITGEHGNDIGYAIATRNPPPQVGWSWVEEGLVPGPGWDKWGPSVAYDALTGDFVLATCAGDCICVAIYDSALGEFRDLGPGPGWKMIALDGNKPWIVAGGVVGSLQQPKQEFYICYNDPQTPGRPAYLRSTDGGYTWQGDQITIDGAPLTNWNNPQPAVHGNGPLYAAIVSGEDAGTTGIRVVKGQDPLDPNDPMTWEYLESSQDVPLEIPLYVTDVKQYVPIDFEAFTIGQLAVDPYSSAKLYLVYHDLVEAPSARADEDVDVFLQVLTEQAGGSWSAGNRVQVNDPDDPDADTPIDQLIPALTVTPGPSGTPASTRVHVIFYDDRKFDTQQDSPPPEYPKFDVFYAYSTNGGVSFEWDDEELYQIPPETCVNYELVDSGFKFGHYIGIAPQVPAAIAGHRIWTSFTGTHAADTTDHKSVIYSSQIPWASP